MLTLSQLLRYCFLRSTHIAALVGRSRDRSNDQLCRLFHAGYVDRPRAQVDYYPTAGSVRTRRTWSAPSLRARSGLRQHGSDPQQSRRGPAFIEHQLEIVDLHVALERSTRGRSDLRLIHPEQIIMNAPERTRRMRNPLALRARILQNDRAYDVGAVPDLVFGLLFPDGRRERIGDASRRRRQVRDYL